MWGFVSSKTQVNLVMVWKFLRFLNIIYLSIKKTFNTFCDFPEGCSTMYETAVYFQTKREFRYLISVLLPHNLLEERVWSQWLQPDSGPPAAPEILQSQKGPDMAWRGMCLRHCMRKQKQVVKQNDRSNNPPCRTSSIEYRRQRKKVCLGNRLT